MVATRCTYHTPALGPACCVWEVGKSAERARKEHQQHYQLSCSEALVVVSVRASALSGG